MISFSRKNIPFIIFSRCFSRYSLFTNDDKIYHSYMYTSRSFQSDLTFSYKDIISAIMSKF